MLCWALYSGTLCNCVCVCVCVYVFMFLAFRKKMTERSEASLQVSEFGVNAEGKSRTRFPLFYEGFSLGSQGLDVKMTR